jgi:dTDP-4-amino-4,6-dideoxygalactose transaminase
MIPRQIINKIHYIKICIDFLLHKKFKNYNQLEIKLTDIFRTVEKPIFVGRARSGIFLAVKIFLNKQKPKILMSPFTIPDVVNMVVCAGGVPVFLDFEKNTTFLNILELEEALKTNEFSALILTHYNINEYKYKKIHDICKKNNIKLIEDCAISIGGSADNYNIGSLSDAKVYSFSSFKFINFFYGGLIFFKDSNYFQIAKKETSNWKKLSFFDYAEPFLNAIKFQILTSKIFYSFITKIFYLNFNKKNFTIKNYIRFVPQEMDNSYFSLPADPFFFEIDRKILNFDRLQNHRRKISNIYFQYLKHISIPSGLTTELINTSSCYNYLINVKNKNLMRKKLADMGFDTGNTMYQNCHKNENYKNIAGSSKNLNMLIDNSLVLPTHQLISEAYAIKISRAILDNYL